MRKEIIRISTISLAFILLLSLLLQPIYKMNTKLIYSKFDNKIQELQEERNKDLEAYFDHTFKKESFNVVSSKDGINVINLSDWAWQLYVNNDDYQEVENGVVIKDGFRLIYNDTYYFENLALYASGKNALVKIILNGKEIASKELSENLDRHFFEIENIHEHEFDSDKKCTICGKTVEEVNQEEKQKLEIKFEGDEVTLQRLKLTEEAPYSKEEAKMLFLWDIIMYSGLVTTNENLVNIESVDLYREYIIEEVEKLIEGVPFLSLFKMAIQDIEYDLSLFKSLSGLSFSDRLSKYIEGRRCPFISIMMFAMGLGVLGSIAYIAVRFIFDLIFKKTSNYLIPSLVLFGSFVVMLNVSTFTTTNF